MRYISTRGRAESASAARAVLRGLAPDGGLYVPESFPRLDSRLWAEKAPYHERALGVMRPYFEEFEALDLEKAYRRFDHELIAPVRAEGDGIFYLELFHGPTCAFKDMALQVLPRLMENARELAGEKGKIVILTATSGDTGKAALEAFRDIEGVRVVCFYPADGVSQVQKLQMRTQEGNNLHVIGVEGNFDHAQTGIKRIFDDAALREKLSREGISFSSANSINWGRLAPQIAYYADAYAQMVVSGALSPGQTLNVCVPTGNFGNILAAWIAKKMGLPLGRLICASNSNNVLTGLISSGVYDARRELVATISPSMDILVSSNWERALYFLSGGDGGLVESCMDKLRRDSVYELPEEVRRGLSAGFYGGFCGEEETRAEIKAVYEASGILLDPHTAVARSVCRRYRLETGDDTPVLITATASPFKFCAGVLEALTGEKREDGPELARQLEGLASVACPAPLRGLEDKAVLHSLLVKPEDMRDTVEGLVLGNM